MDEIPCGTRNKVYAVTEHAVHNNHVIDWKKAKVIDHRSSWKQRSIMESWYIAKQGNNAMNRDTAMLPGVYKNIIA